MRWRLGAWNGGLVAALLLVCGFCSADSGKVVLPNIDGASTTVLRNRGQKAEVFFFITNDCPITNSYAPEIERICTAYTPKKIRFYVVYADPSLSAADARKHAKDYGLKCPGLMDPTHLLVKRFQATVMPEVAVVSPEGKLLYRGRIDDRYIDFGKARYQATTHDLRDALDAVLQGKPVPHPITKAVGCYIPPAK